MIRGNALLAATICERCGRMTVDTVVHNDLYHPVPRRRKDEPIAEVGVIDLTEPDPDTPVVYGHHLGEEKQSAAEPIADVREASASRYPLGA